jgi:hypothetical protein
MARTALFDHASHLSSYLIFVVRKMWIVEDCVLLSNVTAEWSLVALAWNIKRMSVLRGA